MTYTVRSGLPELVKELKSIPDGNLLTKELRDGLRDAAKPMVEAVRAAVRDVPSTDGKGGGRGTRSKYATARSKAKKQSLRSKAGLRNARLRESIARAVRLDVRSDSVTVRVAPDLMPNGQKSLPVYMEGLRPWRHPVYGHDDRWVTQKAHPFFWKTIERELPAFEEAADKAIAQTMRSAGL